MNVTNAFSKRFLELRKKSGMRQQELGAALGISRGAISYYEKGERVPDIEILSRISKFFNVSCDYLLGITDIETLDVDTKGISIKTGLQEKSIETLNSYQNNSKRPAKDKYDTVPAFSTLYLETVNRLIAYSDIIENITRYLYLHFDKFYDDSNFRDEDLYRHISELGLFDSRIGIEYSDDYGYLSQVFLLEIQKELIKMREDTDQCPPPRISPLVHDDAIQEFLNKGDIE